MEKAVMTRNQSLWFRIVLFLAGGGIVAVAFFLINGGRIVSDADMFMWISIALMYLIAFTPFFFSSISIANFSGKIPSLAMVWTGIILYILASIVVILLLSKGISLHVAIIVQAVILFLFGIDVYLACFASAHVRQVSIEEKNKAQYIAEIKSKAQILALSINSLPGEYENPQKILKQTMEDIKYLSPVKGDMGYELELELKIIIALNTLSELCKDIATGGHPIGLESEAKHLQMLIKERKLLRN